MEEAIQSSVYVASPDFAGWLMKRGFHVSEFHFPNLFYSLFVFFVVVEKVMEKTLDCFTWC